ncbi:MAG TPA: hypothetical protein DCF49_10510 [Lachnospiraceae bacterium]|nr:hypothetical protein [Lachnospiraceae bacterium]
MNEFKKHKNQIYLGITVLALALAAVLLIDHAVRRGQEQSEAAETVTMKTEKEKKDSVIISVNTETIQDGLANMGVLITQEYYFTQLEKYSKEKTYLKFITTLSEFTYSYDGKVLAGVDFDKIKVTKDDGANTITIVMPPSEIRAVTIDRDTFKIYSEKESIWNPLKLEDYNISLAEFENAARDKAVQNGILERSDEQARNLVRQFILNLPNMSKYTINFQ